MRPILFNPDNIRKIIAGEKTMTRRVIEPHVEIGDIRLSSFRRLLIESCPYNCDYLWVQEKWCGSRKHPINEPLRYRAAYSDDVNVALSQDHAFGLYDWRPATIMPYWACRIHLRVVNIRVELLQEISREDVVKEGCDSIDSFRQLWDSINAVRGYEWEENPAVYVIEFETYLGYSE
jgi:hypothetical protein